MNGKNPISVLQEHCAKKGLQLPIYTISESTNRNLPYFKCLVRVQELSESGEGWTKKEAKQNASISLMTKLQNEKASHVLKKSEQPVPKQQKVVPTMYNPTMEQLSLNEVLGSEKARTRKLFKAYKECKNEKFIPEAGLCLSDRHNFFYDMDERLKKQALDIINRNQGSSKEKVSGLLNVLGIPYKESYFTSGMGPMIFIELDCEIDAVFAHKKEFVYDEILNYFRDML